MHPPCEVDLDHGCFISKILTSIKSCRKSLTQLDETVRGGVLDIIYFKLNSYEFKVSNKMYGIQYPLHRPANSHGLRKKNDSFAIIILYFYISLELTHHFSCYKLFLYNCNHCIYNLYVVISVPFL
jgi:hypothetical protein